MLRLISRKPPRLELPNVNAIEETREPRHELKLLSEEGGVAVDLSRGYRRIIEERADRHEILRSMALPDMPERPECASVPAEPGCRPEERKPMPEHVRDVIENTERWRADVQGPLSAALFEADEGYILVISDKNEGFRWRYEFVEEERLVGVSVTTEVHSYNPGTGEIVRLPEAEPVRYIGFVSGEPLAFTDDEYEAIVVSDEGIRASALRSGFPKLITAQRVRPSSSFYFPGDAYLRADESLPS